MLRSKLIENPKFISSMQHSPSPTSITNNSEKTFHQKTSNSNIVNNKYTENFIKVNFDIKNKQQASDKYSPGMFLHIFKNEQKKGLKALNLDKNDEDQINQDNKTKVLKKEECEVQGKNSEKDLVSKKPLVKDNSTYSNVNNFSTKTKPDFKKDVESSSSTGFIKLNPIENLKEKIFLEDKPNNSQNVGNIGNSNFNVAEKSSFSKTFTSNIGDLSLKKIKIDKIDFKEKTCSNFNLISFNWEKEKIPDIKHVNNLNNKNHISNSDVRNKIIHDVKKEYKELINESLNVQKKFSEKINNKILNKIESFK